MYLEAVIKVILFDAFLVGTSGALLWHFWHIWRHGHYLIGEPNILIRILETAGILVILIFGLVRCIQDLKRASRKGLLESD